MLWAGPPEEFRSVPKPHERDTETFTVYRKCNGKSFLLINILAVGEKNLRRVHRYKQHSHSF